MYGLGRDRTPMSLQNACDKFIGLELLGAEDAEDETPDEPSQEPAPKANAQSVLTKAVNATVGDDGWASLSAIGNHIRPQPAVLQPPRLRPRQAGRTRGRAALPGDPGRGHEHRGPVEGAKKATAKKTAAKKTATKKAVLGLLAGNRWGAGAVPLP